MSLRALLLAAVVLPIATHAAPPAATDLRDAAIAVGFEARNRCPDLIQSDPQDPQAALVVLVVGPSGVPSQPSIKSSSGSGSLDAAAVSCVMKLRFLPAVRAGEGTAVASWQEIAWKWGRTQLAQSPAAATPPATAPAPPANVTIPTMATIPSAAIVAATAPTGTEVRVCADEGGKLRGDPLVTRSSGDAALDAAAVGIARSGAPYYRPGCVQLVIRFEPQ